MSFLGKIVGVIAMCLVCFAVLFGVLTRIPAVQDAMFDKALEKNFGPRAAPLLRDEGINVFFCGTGSPLPSKKRAQTCTAIFAGGKYFLVDAGTGSWENIQAAGIPGEKLAGILLTHFHSDHIGDLGEADLGSWVAGRPGKLAVYGPEGVQRVVNGVNEEFALDHEYRTAHHGAAIADPASQGLEAHSFDGSAQSVIYDESGLKITAFPVKHDPVKPAVGYRFDYEGRSVVVSGDTAPTEYIVTAAKGADLLIHEAQANHMVAKMRAAAEKAGNTRVAKIFGDIPSYHTSPEDAAREANEAGVKLLALTHFTPAPDNAVAKRIFMRGVSKIRREGVVMADDGMIIELPKEGGEKIVKP